MSDGGKSTAELGRTLRRHRKAKRLTGPELAGRLGVSQGTISKLENGRLPPTIDFLYYPGQTYPGNPWSNWGDSVAAGGKYYASIGDHLAIGGKADGSTSSAA